MEIILLKNNYERRLVLVERKRGCLLAKSFVTYYVQKTDDNDLSQTLL